MPQRRQTNTFYGLQFEQFMSSLKGELKTYENMDSLIEIQKNAIDVAQESMLAKPDTNYIKELAAHVKIEFNKIKK